MACCYVYGVTLKFHSFIHSYAPRPFYGCAYACTMHYAPDHSKPDGYGPAVLARVTEMFTLNFFSCRPRHFYDRRLLHGRLTNKH